MLINRFEDPFYIRKYWATLNKCRLINNTTLCRLCLNMQILLLQGDRLIDLDLPTLAFIVGFDQHDMDLACGKPVAHSCN